MAGGDVIVILVITIGTIVAANSRASQLLAQGYTKEALERLSQVFGIDHVPNLTNHRSPPEYMLELYKSVAFDDGISKKANPYDADVVRGFPDRATKHQTHYYFNISFVDHTEDVLAAELRLYKTRPDYTTLNYLQRTGNTHVIKLRLYQVTSESWEQDPGSLVILNERQISTHSTGWQVFTVTDTLRAWVNGTSPNHGFLVTASTLDGRSVNGSLVRFAQRLEHHDSKQPVLVVFSGDMVTRYVHTRHRDTSSEADILDPTSAVEYPEDIAAARQGYIRYLNEAHRAQNGGVFPEHYRGYMSTADHLRLLEESRRARQIHERRAQAQLREGRSRGRRAKLRNKRTVREYRPRRGAEYYKSSKRRHKACERSELYVDFSEIGWSGWIISPKGYNAYHCYGECPFPLGQYHRPTNHATVQSIVHTMRIDKKVQLPCCVPDKLYSISLLYFDDEENVILKQYNEMVAASCGCH